MAKTQEPTKPMLRIWDRRMGRDDMPMMGWEEVPQLTIESTRSNDLFLELKDDGTLQIITMQGTITIEPQSHHISITQMVGEKPRFTTKGGAQ